MLFVVWSVLNAVVAVYLLWFNVFSLCVVCGLLFVVCRLAFGVRCLLCVIRCLWFVVYCLRLAVC